MWFGAAVLALLVVSLLAAEDGTAPAADPSQKAAPRKPLADGESTGAVIRDDPSPAPAPGPPRRSTTPPPAESEDVPPKMERTPPEQLAGWKTNATSRLTGALVGGVVGLGLMGGLAAATTCQTCAPGAGLFRPETLVLGFSAPLVGLVGALLGYGLGGGKVSVGAGVAGALAGLGAAALYLVLHLLVVPMDPSLTWPALFGASALAVGLQAVVMEGRSDALDELPFLVTPGRRFALTTLGLVGSYAAVAVLVALGGTASSPTLSTIMLLGGLAAAPLIPWTIHQSLGGRASVGAAYLSWLGVLAVAGGSAALAGLTLTTIDTRALAVSISAVTVGLLTAVFGLPLALEAAHGWAMTEEVDKRAAERKKTVSASPSIVPIGGGAMLGVSGRFCVPSGSPWMRVEPENGQHVHDSLTRECGARSRCGHLAQRGEDRTAKARRDEANPLCLRRRCGQFPTTSRASVPHVSPMSAPTITSSG